MVDPIFGQGESALREVIRHNPIEMLDAYQLKPGELQMYVCYGKHDEFNLAAQIESFLYVARQRGLEVGVGYDPEGKHDLATAVRLFPGLVDWLGPRLAAFASIQ
jgi:hypothetical protein